MQTRLIGGASYFLRTELEASNPSRREGIDVVTETRWRFTTSNLVKAAIKNLKLPDWVYETSMNYINRFFLTRSISKNDRHLVVGGAILLASKVQESPRSVQDVAYVVLQLKNANKQKPQHGLDQNTLEQFMEGVVLAEQAMLFSLNFNLNVETHVSLARRLLEPLELMAKASPPPEEAEANQLKLGLFAAFMFFLNDSALTNLSLQYPNSKVAPVALMMAAKRLAATRYSGKEPPAALQRVLALANDAEWFASKGLSLDVAADIEAQIFDLYGTSPAQPSSQQQRSQLQSAQLQHQSAAGPANVPQTWVQAPQQHRDAGHQSAGPPAAACAALTSAAPQVVSTLASTEGGEAPTASNNTAILNPEVSPGEQVLPESGCLEHHHPEHAQSPPAAAANVGTAGRPSSSVAAMPTAGATAGGTPEMPHQSSPQDQQASQQQPAFPRQEQQQHRVCKRVSDGDEGVNGEQQATSELQVVPADRTEGNAESAAAKTAACDGNGPEDSGNDHCSPNGLTNGNASGSGCGQADCQPEVCSRPDVTGPDTQPTQLHDSANGNEVEGCAHLNNVACACQVTDHKRSWVENGGEEGMLRGEILCNGVEHVSKVRRLDEAQTVVSHHAP